MGYNPMNCMNIYLVQRTVDADYDEYVEWVVFAKDKPQALCISPCPWGTADGMDSSCSLYREVEVTLLGTSFEESEAKLICASFRAG